ncbi:MAG: CoA transferase [Dehalococcoidia bacterium]
MSPSALRYRSESAPSPSKGRVLSGLRVLELGSYISAAYCARLLAEQGAQVIKIEQPGAGDLARRHGPFPDNVPDCERSGLFLFLNTSKLGVTLDVATPTGADLILELVRHADVVVHNYLPQDLERLGFTYERLRRVNPTLVLTSVTAFGQEGPYSRHKAYAINAAAGGGAAHRIGKPDRYPIATPYERIDYWGGMNGAAATMLALLVRRRSGLGQHVDIAATEALNTFGNGNDTVNYVDTGAITRRHGIRTPIWYPYTVLPCKDGYFAMIIAHDHHWQRWLELMGNPEWAQNPRYQDRPAMGHDYPEEVDELVKPFLARHTKQELWAMCRERKIPWHAVQTIDEVLEWEQFKARDYWQRVADGRGAEWRLPGPQLRLVGTPAGPMGPAPTLGQHNTEVFGQLLGIPPRELASLRRTGVI